MKGMTSNPIPLGHRLYYVGTCQPHIWVHWGEQSKRENTVFPSASELGNCLQVKRYNSFFQKTSMFCLCTQGSCISFRGNQESVCLCHHHNSFLLFHSYKMAAEFLGHHLGGLRGSFLPRNSQLIPSYISW